MAFKKVVMILVCSYGFLCSCERPGKFSGEIRVLENLLIEKTTEIQKLRDAAKQGIPSLNGKLIHLVFFNLKSDLEEKELSQFIEVIESLRKISTIENLIYGDYLEVGDERSMKENELVMQVVFKDMNGLKIYQKDSIHQNVKMKLSVFLESAPVTYDYTVAE